jgi:hypothetical protein
MAFDGDAIAIGPRKDRRVWYQLQEGKQLREEGWPLRQIVLLEDENQDVGQLVLQRCGVTERVR